MKTMLAVCAMLFLPLYALAAECHNGVFKTQGTYQNVRDSVQFSIEGKGLKITHSNMIADMLERTGKDLGKTKQIYEFGEQMEFCSATVSRKMMEADPHTMVLCPYSVSVYKIPDDPAIYVAYRKPPRTRNPALKKALDDMENLLTEIIKDAL
ncbi:MAG: DUF302 domain-containing protein [Thiobacillus sp.]